MRPALEQVALLTPELIHEHIQISFLRFHPVLVPFLRSQPGADDPALLRCYIARYAERANYLYLEDDRDPQAVRALVLCELPNLRRALDLLLAQRQQEVATVLATHIIKFLNNFGRLRERDEVRQRLAQAFPKREGSTGDTLTRAEYFQQVDLGMNEFNRGNIWAAYAHFKALLTRIEALPEGTPRGPGSYEHCYTLSQIAHCLRAGGKPATAEAQLRPALAIIEVLLKQAPENRNFIHQQSALLTGLGDALLAQGHYREARAVYEQSLNLDRQQGDVQGQAVILGQLGAVAFKEGNYGEARRRYTETCNLFHILGEPAAEAGAWYQRGMVAQEEGRAEAERCYRISLKLREQHGYLADAADTCNQLAILAERAERPAEAEGWYKRALELDEQVRPGSLEHAAHLNNLADLLVNEVRAGHIWQERLTEARGYAEQALTIIEPLGASAEPWFNLCVLANIAEMGRQAEVAHAYRRREHETYAEFAGNRAHIDQHERLIHDVVAAARGNTQLQAMVEAALPELEESGWHISAAIQRIWAGERDWHALTEELDRQDALLILCILETMDSSVRPQPLGEQDKT